MKGSIDGFNNFPESEWHWNPIVDEEGEIVNRPDWESCNRD